MAVLCFVFSPFLSNAATYVVDSNADTDNFLGYTLGDGTNTLRKCIRLANTNAGLDAIQFNITGSTVITCTSGIVWYNISDQITIDGYTQPGSGAGNPTIELNGAGVASLYVFFLNAGSDNSTIQGLIMYGAGTGIRMDSDGNTVSGCYIGTDNTGNGAPSSPITTYGIWGFNASNNTIGGSGGVVDRNVIGLCGSDGVRFQGVSSDNVFLGNYIGLGADGFTAMGNNGNGIWCNEVAYVIVGGTGVNDGNVICSNVGHAVSVFGAASLETIIQGNIIGLTADGLTARVNFLRGIDLNQNENSQIGGTDINARNIISNNGWAGISLIACPGTVVENNYIGSDITGNVDMGNFQHGIQLINSADVTIGGLTSASRNVIVGNVFSGISVEQISPNLIAKNNYIGIGADGTTVVKNDENGYISINMHGSAIISGSVYIICI